jgi:hypothetical protein
MSAPDTGAVACAQEAILIEARFQAHGGMYLRGKAMAEIARGLGVLSPELEKIAARVEEMYARHHQRRKVA